MLEKEKQNAVITMGGKRGPNWFKSTTPYGYNIALCISAVIKEIRRGNEEHAVYWSYQIAISGPEAEKFLWELLRVHSIEDISLSNPEAINIVCNVMNLYFDLPNTDNRKYAVLTYIVVYMARQTKTRYTNDLFLNIISRLHSGDMKLEIPDYAIDLHSPEGRKMGRGLGHYLLEASFLENEDNRFSKKYKAELLKQNKQP